ncbi:MAG: PAS domain S-box protein, partial [Ignavibacteria bacterium]|nr:PAS domain S-box protein [Ignavibacteria bacterium]
MGKKIEAVDCASEKHTSKHFKKSLETYKLLFESSGIPICVFDINGTIILYNQAAIKIIGGTAKEYVGKSLIEIFDDNIGQEYIKRLLLTAESDVSLQFEDFVQLPTGKYWFLSNFTSIQNSEGIVIGIQVVWQNITEHKQKIDAISKNEEKFQALFSALTDVIIEIDSDGRLVEVLSLNPSLHSESYGELVGKTLHEIFPKAQADFILNNVRRTLEKREA